MNVAEAAAKYGVSTQAIYQQIVKLPNKGRKPESKELSAEAETMLAKKYGITETDFAMLAKVDKDLQNVAKSLEEENRTLRGELEGLKNAYNLLKKLYEAEQKLSQERAGERDFLREQLAMVNRKSLPAAKEPTEQKQEEQPAAQEPASQQKEQRKEEQSEPRSEREQVQKKVGLFGWLMRK